MIVVADNLNTRNKAYMEALGRRDRRALAEMAGELLRAGADMINIQCSLDGADDEENLPWAVEAVREASSTLSLDSRSTDALEKAVRLLKRPPLINFLSLTEPDNREGLLSLVADSGASLVLRAAKAVTPASLEAKLQIIEELLEMANAMDIPNERLFADPSVVHIGKGVDQRHLVNSCDFIKALKEMVEPPINTIAWISNVSTGLPARLKGTVEGSFLSYLAGAGLDAAMLNVLEPEMKRTVYLIKSFRDEMVFSPADMTGGS